MAKILMFRGVEQEHGYELETSSTGGRGETSQQKVDLSKCCQPLTHSLLPQVTFIMQCKDERGREGVLVGVEVFS